MITEAQERGRKQRGGGERERWILVLHQRPKGERKVKQICFLAGNRSYQQPYVIKAR